MAGRFTFLLLLGCVLCTVATIDPETPQTVNTGAIYGFTLNRTQPLWTSRAENSSLMRTPFQWTSFSEFVRFQVSPGFPNNETQYIDSTFAIYNVSDQYHLSTDQEDVTIALSPFGPCYGNPLSQINQSVSEYLNLTTPDRLQNFSVNGTISRIYQNALLAAEKPQWILFGPKVQVYYAIPGPDLPNQALQIEIRRRNSSVTPPSILFSTLTIATEQQCLNTKRVPGPGIIEKFQITQTADLEFVAHSFLAKIPKDTPIFLTVNANLTSSSAPSYNSLYYITAHFVGTPDPLSNDVGVIIGVTFGVLILIVVVGVVYYLYNKRRKLEYAKIQA